MNNSPEEKNIPEVSEQTVSENIEKIKELKSRAKTAEADGAKAPKNTAFVNPYDPKHSKERRRHPKRHTFLVAMIIYVSIAFLIIGTAVCIGWKYAPLAAEASPDRFVDSLASTTTADGWRQHLRIQLPKTYPEYEDASKLAYEVLSPAFNVGKVTYIRYAARGGAPVYELFSDGKSFATMTLKDVSEGALSLPVWEIGVIDFHVSFFDNVGFRHVNVTVPDGAVLTVNGIDGVAGNKTESVKYPELSPAEAQSDVAPCTRYSFDDLYYQPEISATLGGASLECVKLNENEYYFKYPESHTHSLTVTAPEGMTVLVGDAVVNEDWASKSQIEGELGELDDGGSGTLPILNVWTVDGLFSTPTVRGEVYGNAVPLKTQTETDYVFTVPAECKYTITLILPAGAEATVNGKPLDASTKIEGGASAEELGSGMTYLGKFGVTELSAVPEAVPAFDKYVISGYLALPKITATLGGTALAEAGVRVEEYDVLWEFDYPVGKTPAKDRVNVAKNFANEYIEYVCDGGAWTHPENSKAFNENYDALLAAMVEGTAGYIGIMQSYGVVYKLPPSDSFKVDSLAVSDAISYTPACISTRLDYKLTRTVSIDGVPATESLEGSIMVLQVLYQNEWRVWSFFLDGGIAELV